MSRCEPLLWTQYYHQNIAVCDSKSLAKFMAQTWVAINMVQNHKVLILMAILLARAVSPTYQTLNANNANAYHTNLQTFFIADIIKGTSAAVL